MGLAWFEVKPTELLIIVKEWNHLKGIFWVKYNLNSTVGIQYQKIILPKTKLKSVELHTMQLF